MSANNAIYVLTVIEKFPEGYMGGKPFGERTHERHFVFEDDVDYMGELISSGKLTRELAWRLAMKSANWLGLRGTAFEVAYQKSKDYATEYGICCATVEYQHE